MKIQIATLMLLIGTTAFANNSLFSYSGTNAQTGQKCSLSFEVDDSGELYGYEIFESEAQQDSKALGSGLSNLNYTIAPKKSILGNKVTYNDKIKRKNETKTYKLVLKGRSFDKLNAVKHLANRTYLGVELEKSSIQCNDLILDQVID